MNNIDDLKLAHGHSSNHVDELLASDVCGCFYCLEIYPPSSIADWVEISESKLPDAPLIKDTAICPKCGIDSVIGSASGYPITKKFLKIMKQRWF